MEKAFNFFRVFDLAFFVPGALFLAGLVGSGVLKANGVSSHVSTPKAANVLALIVSAILGSFLLGLLCHAVYRLVDYVVWRVRGRPVDDTWYNVLQKDNPKHELAQYFWYLRSTCWNTSVACLAVCGLMIFSHCSAWALIAGLAVPVFLLLGFDYHRALERAAR